MSSIGGRDQRHPRAVPDPILLDRGPLDGVLDADRADVPERYRSLVDLVDICRSPATAAEHRGLDDAVVAFRLVRAAQATRRRRGRRRAVFLAAVATASIGSTAAAAAERLPGPLQDLADNVLTIVGFDGASPRHEAQGRSRSGFTAVAPFHVTELSAADPASSASSTTAAAPWVLRMPTAAGTGVLQAADVATFASPEEMAIVTIAPSDPSSAPGSEAPAVEAPPAASPAPAPGPPAGTASYAPTTPVAPAADAADPAIPVVDQPVVAPSEPPPPTAAVDLAVGDPGPPPSPPGGGRDGVPGPPVSTPGVGWGPLDGVPGPPDGVPGPPVSTPGVGWGPHDGVPGPPDGVPGPPVSTPGVGPGRPTLDGG